MWGLTADNVIRFEVVDAEGRALEATPGHNPDLFWALRGGGASFGIVTEITVRVQPIGSVVVVHLEWHSSTRRRYYPRGSSTRCPRRMSFHSPLSSAARRRARSRAKPRASGFANLVNDSTRQKCYPCLQYQP